MRVLVVEDEKKIAFFLRKGLEERGFVVDVCHRGDEGCELATTRCYALTLLTALLLAPLAALHAGRNVTEVPGFGILRDGFFQSLEIFGAMSSDDWN